MTYGVNSLENHSVRACALTPRKWLSYSERRSSFLCSDVNASVNQMTRAGAFDE